MNNVVATGSEGKVRGGAGQTEEKERETVKGGEGKSMSRCKRGESGVARQSCECR